MIKASEISEIIKRQLAGYEAQVDLQEVGRVIEAGDGIARVYGLEKAMAGELLQFPGDVVGMVLNLEEDNVGAVLFHNEQTTYFDDGHKPHVAVADELGDKRVTLLKNHGAIVASDHTFTRAFGDNAAFDRAEKLIILLDKYDALRRRGKRTHEQAISWLRERVENHARFRADPEFSSLIQALDDAVGSLQSAYG